MLVFSFSFVFIDTKDSLSMPICEDFMKRQIFITFVLLILCALDLPAQTPFVSKVWKADNGDGTYKNPILHADYSDPDAIRVGDDFYMTASSFNAVPGLPILHSKDF